MLPSDARTGAAARSQGSEGPAVPSRVITQAAVSRNPKQVHILLLGVPRSVSPRPRLPELQGEDHTFTANSLLPPGGGGGIILRSIARQTVIPSATGKKRTPGLLDPHSEILIRLASPLSSSAPPLMQLC